MKPVVLLLIASVTAAGPAPDTKPTGGTGTIYLGSYARKIAVIDEATEKVAASIPLATGLPWAVRLSRDRARFFVQSADQEHFEVIDVASRRTIDTFTLSEGNKHVRALAFDVEPQNRFMVLVTRTLTKLPDRFEIGAPAFIQYDLQEHKVVRTVPWATDPQPQYYYLLLRLSPDGKLLYVFSNEIVIYDTTSLKQIDSWDLALPNEPGLGRFDLSAMDETNDDPGYFTALFGMEDPVASRRLLVVGRVDLGHKRIEFFPVGPAPDKGDVSFALAPDRKRGYVERIPPAVARITGISEHMMRDAVDGHLAWRELSDQAASLSQQPAPTVIHFARFEQTFLRTLGAGVFPRYNRMLWIA
jgi:hypothetical protein